MITACYPLKVGVEGDVISYTDSSIETVTEVEENGDFYTKITSMPKLPLKNMD